MSQTKDNKTTSNESEPILEMEETLEESNADAEVSVNASLEKAIETFRKLREQKGPLSDKELEELD